MRARSIVALAVIALSGSRVPAETRAVLQGLAVVGGDNDARPVRRARAHVQCGGGAVDTYTDTTGTFRVDAGASGTCHVTIEKPGFVMAESGDVPVPPDGSTVRIHMLRGAAIEGRVTTPAGDGIPNTMVDAVVVERIAGHA